MQRKHGEKSIICDVEECEKAFSTKLDVTTHKRLAHSDTFKCRWCDESFHHWRTRRKHEEAEHGFTVKKDELDKMD